MDLHGLNSYNTINTDGFWSPCDPRPTGSMCPYGQQLVRPESLPSMFGGLCTCDGQGCVGGRPNGSLQKPTLEDWGFSKEPFCKHLLSNVRKMIRYDGM